MAYNSYQPYRPKMSSAEAYQIAMMLEQQKQAEAKKKGGGGAGALLGAGGAGGGGYYALSGGAAPGVTTGATSLAGATSAPAMLAPEVGAVLPSITGAGTAPGSMAMLNPSYFDMGLGELTNIPVTSSASSGAGASGAASGAGGTAGQSSYAAMTGGPGSLGYWAGPAAFLATAPMWAPPLAKGGKKVGKAISGALGIGGKHNIQIPYDPANAAKSVVINNQLPGMANLKDETKFNILNQYRAAGALGDQHSSKADPLVSQTTPDNASSVQIGAAYLTETEKNKLRNRYGKNWNPRVISADEWSEILSPIGRNDKGMQKMNAFKDATKAYDDAVFNQRVMDVMAQTQPQAQPTPVPRAPMGSGVVNSPMLQPPRSNTRSPGIDEFGNRINYSRR